jgi:glucose/arabinose dehydrogenase
VTTDGDKVTNQEIVFAEMGRVRTVVQGPDGYLYVLLASPGRVARMSPVETGTYDREQARLRSLQDAAAPR